MWLRLNQETELTTPNGQKLEISKTEWPQALFSEDVDDDDDEDNYIQYFLYGHLLLAVSYAHYNLKFS
jgi:hypothetical protein